MGIGLGVGAYWCVNEKVEQQRAAHTCSQTAHFPTPPLRFFFSKSIDILHPKHLAP